MVWPAFKSGESASTVLLLTWVLYYLTGQSSSSARTIPHKFSSESSALAGGALRLCWGAVSTLGGSKFRGREGKGIPPGTQVAHTAAQEKGGEPAVT